jgi:hypothetical protein
MKIQQIALLLFTPSLAATTAAQGLDWTVVQQIAPGTPIVVVADRRTVCSFLAANSDQLMCQVHSAGHGHPKPDVDLTFSRAEIRQVLTGRAFQDETYDYSKGFLSLILAAEGGGGLDSANQPTSFAGVRVGGPFSVDLQYDRVHGMNGFSAEGSAVLPVFRVPRFKYGSERKFLKIFAEPGMGYRAGDGPFGGYTSGKVMAVLLTDTWSDGWTAPYVEIQRRFPFESPFDGDTRLAFGLMLAVCEHCGLD